MFQSPATRIQQQNWNAVADDWSNQFDWYAAAFAPFITWCINAIELEPHHRVLDIACGTGVPALAIAAQLESGNSMVATDISPEMLRLLARRAYSMPLITINFAVVDAHALSFPDHSFDAVTCGFGLMFCADPTRVLMEMRRVLRPGGRFAISTWAPPAENSFITTYGRAVAEVLSLPRYDRAAPGPFRFTQTDELRTLLSSAGFIDVIAERRAQAVTYDSVDAYLRISQALTPGLTPQLRALPAKEASRLRELVEQAVLPFQHARTVQLTATPICVSGRA